MTGKSPQQTAQALILLLEARESASDKALAQLISHLESLDYFSVLPVYIQIRNHLRKAKEEQQLSRLEDLEKEIAQVLERISRPLSFSEAKELQVLEKILTTEFPETAGGQDKDIDVYYTHRTMGRKDQAKETYQRLCSKYPDPELRVCLFRYRRTGSPLFLPLFMEARKLVARGLETRIRQNILAISEAFSQASSPLELMSGIKKVMAFLPGYRPKALQVLNRLTEYSQLLDLQPQRFKSVAGIVIDYLGGNLFQKKEIVLIAPPGMEQEKYSATPRLQTIDIHKVEFTPADLAKILISPKITGTENQTLAYCRLYWEHTRDSELENRILLYSQKHKTHHLSIYLTIRRGQEEGLKDELILYRVYNVLSRSSRYDYNIRKDIYMQRVWASIKPGTEQTDWTGIDKKAYAEEQARLAMDRREQKKEQARSDVERKLEKEKSLRLQAQERLAEKEAGRLKKRQEAEAKAARELEVQKAKRRAVEEKLKAQTTPAAGGWAPYTADQVFSQRATIRERLDKIDTRDQKNLHLIFRNRLEKAAEIFVEDFARTSGSQITNYSRSLAVLSIKDFILAQMDTQDRNWALSKERQDLRDLGLAINDVEPVIDSCLKELEDSLAPVPN